MPESGHKKAKASAMKAMASLGELSIIKIHKKHLIALKPWY